MLICEGQEEADNKRSVCPDHLINFLHYQHRGVTTVKGEKRGKINQNVDCVMAPCHCKQIAATARSGGVPMFLLLPAIPVLVPMLPVHRPTNPALLFFLFHLSLLFLSHFICFCPVFYQSYHESGKRTECFSVPLQLMLGGTRPGTPNLEQVSSRCLAVLTTPLPLQKRP